MLNLKLKGELSSTVVKTIDLETEVWPDSEKCGFGDCTVAMFSDNTINENIRSISHKQRQVLLILTLMLMLFISFQRLYKKS